MKKGSKRRVAAQSRTAEELSALRLRMEIDERDLARWHDDGGTAR